MTKLNRYQSPAERFEASYIPEPNSGCWLWVAPGTPNGYGRFGLEGRNYLSHRASWMLHRGPIPDGLWVLHKCDVRCCVNPDHLYLGDIDDNTADMFARGRHVTQASPHLVLRGSKHGNAKLTEQNVAQIKQRMLRGESIRPLADAFRVHHGAIWQIKKGLTWKHVPPFGHIRARSPSRRRPRCRVTCSARRCWRASI